MEATSFRENQAQMFSAVRKPQAIYCEKNQTKTLVIIVSVRSGPNPNHKVWLWATKFLLALKYY